MFVNHWSTLVWYGLTNDCREHHCPIISNCFKRKWLNRDRSVMHLDQLQLWNSKTFKVLLPVMSWPVLFPNGLRACWSNQYCSISNYIYILIIHDCNKMQENITPVVDDHQNHDHRRGYDIDQHMTFDACYAMWYVRSQFRSPVNNRLLAFGGRNY